MGIVNINCGMDSDSYKDYTRMADVEAMYSDNLQRRVKNFADCIAFVACRDCLECENKCRLFELVKADLDELYLHDNQKYYEYLALTFEAISDGTALVARE